MQRHRTGYGPRGKPRRKPLELPRLYWIVSERVFIAQAHWNGKRTTECTRPTGNTACPGCLAEHPARLEHWLTVQDERARERPRVLYLTPHAAANAVGLWKHDGDLYARAVMISRTSNRPNGPMWCNIIDRDDCPRLVPPQDTERRLRRMWAAADRCPGASEVWSPGDADEGLVSMEGGEV